MHLRSFLKAGHPPSLFCAFLYFDISFMVWVLLGALANSIVPDFELNEAQRGLMIALPLLGGAALRLVLGLMTDRLGARNTGIIGLTLTVLPLLLGWFCLFYSVTFGGFVGLATFLNSFFRVQYELSPVHAGYFATACVIAGSLLRPVGGYLADHVGGIRMLTGLYLGVFALLACQALLPPLAIATVLLFFCMGLLGMGNGAVFQLVPLRFPREIGVITGIVGAAGGIGGVFLAPPPPGGAQQPRPLLGGVALFWPPSPGRGARLRFLRALLGGECVRRGGR